MDEQKRANLSALFDALVELPPEARAAGLAAIDDDELRREVASLLEHAREGDTLARMVGQAAELADDGPNREAPPRDLTGRLLGVYRIGALIGAGGMGEVYAAEDSRLGRQVAVKLLPAAQTADPRDPNIIMMCAVARFRPMMKTAGGPLWAMMNLPF